MGKRLETVEEAIEYLHTKSIRELLKVMLDDLRPSITSNEAIVKLIIDLLKSEGLVKIVEELPKSRLINDLWDAMSMNKDFSQCQCEVNEILDKADYLKVTKEW